MEPAIALGFGLIRTPTPPAPDGRRMHCVIRNQQGRVTEPCFDLIEAALLLFRPLLCAVGRLLEGGEREQEEGRKRSHGGVRKIRSVFRLSLMDGWPMARQIQTKIRSEALNARAEQRDAEKIV